MKIYLTGAHSVGKTKLADTIFYSLKRKDIDVGIVKEVVRHEVWPQFESRYESLDDIRKDITEVNYFQKYILSEQLSSEMKMCDIHENIICDRSFDFLAYTGEHGTNLKEILQGTERYSESWKEYLNWMRKDSVFFFIRPEHKFIEDDGFRCQVSWESVNRIDGMIKFILEMLDINYVNINTPSMQERLRTVNAVLDEVI